jgi:phytol kinase
VSLSLRDAVFIAAVIVGMVSLMAAVRYFGRRAGLSAEMQRKLVHVATGTAALSFPVLFTNSLPVFILIGASLVLMLLLRTTKLSSVGSVLHDVKRESYGEIYLALAIAFTFFRAQGEPILYVLPLLVITLSDTASALVGTTYGRRRFIVEDGSKSLEGVVAFFVVTWLCSMVALLLLTDADRTNVVVLSLLIAAFCALVEADSWRGLDNLFVPVGAHLLLTQYLDSGPLELVLIAFLFVGFLGFMLIFAPTLDMTARAARSYAILFFLLLSLLALHNVVLPALLVAAQLLARTARPCQSARPDLDLLAVSTVVALIWLVLGETIGSSVINLFNLSFAAAAVGFLALAVAGKWRLLVAVFALAMGGIFLWVAPMNMPRAIAHTPPWPVVALAIAVPAAAALWRPSWFGTHRSLKLFGPAVLVPLGVLLQGVLA